MITLVTGENSYAVRQAKKRLSTDFSGEAEALDGTSLTGEMLADLTMGVSLFATERLVFVRAISEQKSLWNELDTWLNRVGDETHLVLLEPKPDKRTKSYKWLLKHAAVINCNQLNDRELISWMIDDARIQNIDLTQSLARQLLERVGPEQWELASAIQKLTLSAKPITEQLVHELIDANPQATAFELLDAVMAKDSKRTIKLLQDVRQTEDAYKCMGLLASQLYTLAGCVYGGSRTSQTIAKDLGVHPYVATQMQRVSQQLNMVHVERMSSILHTADVQMKTSGGDPWMILELALTQMSART